jgi:hypothetical protein
MLSNHSKLSDVKSNLVLINLLKFLALVNKLALNSTLYQLLFELIYKELILVCLF